MSLIGFFGYRGGTGRTLCLCNSGLALLEQLHVREAGNPGVLLTDLDLAAPGIAPILDLDPVRRNIFSELLSGASIGRSLSHLTTQLRIDGHGVPLHVLADSNPDTYSISLLTRIFGGEEDPTELRKVLRYLGKRAREDFFAPHTLLDLGTGWRALPREIIKVLDHLVIVMRADRQHRQGTKALLAELQRHLESAQQADVDVHLMLNQVPGDWLSEHSPASADFIEAAGIAKFLTGRGSDQLRTLTIAPWIEAALTQEPLFYPARWSYTEPRGGGLIRQPDNDLECAFRDAIDQLVSNILEGESS